MVISTKLNTLSDYNASAISAAVKKFSAEEGMKVETLGVLFGVRQHMMMPTPPNFEGSVALCLPLPEHSLDTFKRRMNGEDVSYAEVLAEVDAFFDNLLRYFQTASSVLIGSWVIPHYSRGHGLLDLRSNTGTKRLIWQMNERLAQRVEETSGWYLLDSERWLTLPQTGYNSRTYFAAKLPFTSETFHVAGRDVTFAIKAIKGLAIKLVIVDLDNTLWGGIVGDDGWENLKLGGHHSAGEAFVEFQRYLKSLTQRGILLAVSSKNDEVVAWEAFEKNPNMVLQKDDFAAWRINWNDKAANIAEIVAELNLGLQSVMFIDDNPSERSRVKEALPELHVVDIPLSPTLYREAVECYGSFDQAHITKEDELRAKSYLIESKRKTFQSQFKSHEDWLNSLELRAAIQTVDRSNIDRVVQLLNKTNQMNLSTRRLTALELNCWLEKSENEMRAFIISDRFGEYGLTGLVSFTITDHTVNIVDFILSCRVFGRRVEELMLSIALEIAVKKGAEKALATYVPTAKNKPTLEFFELRSEMKVAETSSSGNIVFEKKSLATLHRPNFFQIV
jgi:FkbH-like protein